MSRAVFVLVLLLGIISLLVVGCGGGGEPSPTVTASPEATPAPTATETPMATETPAKTAEPTATEPSSELEEVLNRVKDVGSARFDILFSGLDTPPSTIQVWVKTDPDRQRVETTTEGETVILLVDHGAETMYMYMPSQNTAYLSDYSEAPESELEETLDILDYNPTVVGTEVLDGKTCLVVTFTDEEGVFGKWWIWKDKGFPIRVEATTPQGTVVAEYTNFDFGDFSDSVFQLPAGVEIVEFPTYPDYGE